MGYIAFSRKDILSVRPVIRKYRHYAIEGFSKKNPDIEGGVSRINVGDLTCSFPNPGGRIFKIHDRLHSDSGFELYLRDTLKKSISGLHAYGSNTEVTLEQAKALTAYYLWPYFQGEKCYKVLTDPCNIIYYPVHWKVIDCDDHRILFADYQRRTLRFFRISRHGTSDGPSINVREENITEADLQFSDRKQFGVSYGLCSKPSYARNAVLK